MLELAKSKNLFLMEAIWSRFQPAYLKLKEEINNGAIGEVMHVQSEFGMPIKADRVNKKSLGKQNKNKISVISLDFITLKANLIFKFVYFLKFV